MSFTTAQLGIWRLTMPPHPQATIKPKQRPPHQMNLFGKKKNPIKEEVGTMSFINEYSQFRGYISSGPQDTLHSLNVTTHFKTVLYPEDQIKRWNFRDRGITDDLNGIKTSGLIMYDREKEIMRLILRDQVASRTLNILSFAHILKGFDNEAALAVSARIYVMNIWEDGITETPYLRIEDLLTDTRSVEAIRKLADKNVRFSEDPEVTFVPDRHKFYMAGQDAEAAMVALHRGTATYIQGAPERPYRPDAPPPWRGMNPATLGKTETIARLLERADEEPGAW